MGNLGWYQGITEVSKKVGGPKIFLGLVMVGGYVTFKPIEISIKKAIKASKRVSNLEWDYMFINFYQYDKKFKYKKGQRFNILAMDDDVVLIEIDLEDNNPYFVSKDWLKKNSVLIKDFKIK